MGRRVIGLVVVFALGVVVGVLLLRAAGLRPVGATEAQRRALSVLDRTPALQPVADKESAIVTAVERIEPAVVNIDTVGRASSEDEDRPWRWFVNREVRGKGSGVILTSDGYIVTNNHVIEGASRIRVTLPSGQWHYAKLVGRDPQTDLAVVRVEAANLPAAILGDSDKVKVGEWAIAVGNPLGLGTSVTVGVVSALNRRNLQLDEGRVLDGAIQTDAAINRGNSGGALADIQGRLIGINTAILSSGPSGGNIGIGFALPVNTVRRVTRELIATGKAPEVATKRPWLGIKFAPASQRDRFEIPGVVITEVLPQTPAARAGLSVGDVVLSIDGKPIGDMRDVQEAVMQRQVGDTIRVRVRRPGEAGEREVAAIAAERPDELPSN